MRHHNGKQLYGIQRILATLKMGKNKELKKISLKQKLAGDEQAFLHTGAGMLCQYQQRRNFFKKENRMAPEKRGHA